MVNAREVTKEEEDFIKENLRYDPDTGHLWWTKRFRGRPFDRPAGNLDKTVGYIRISYKIKGILKQHKAHRLAWFLYYGVWPKNQIDHINNFRDDNRVLNLREATNFENQANQKIRKGGTSKYKGVSWDKKHSFWVAMVMLNYKNIFLGYYPDEEEAALAYNKAALEYFGEFAKINDITP